jgi:hypothetical protein
MECYYADLRGELAEQAERAQARGDDASRHAVRQAAIDREERLRVAELRQKSTLQVRLRIANLLIVHQPKFLIAGTLSVAHRGSQPLTLVWDPLLAALEAVPCPACLAPTLRLETNARHQVCCPKCSQQRPQDAPVGHGKNRDRRRRP